MSVKDLYGRLISNTILDFNATDKYLLGYKTISVVGSFTFSTTTSIDLPSGLQENDVVFIVGICNNGSFTSSPTDYTEVINFDLEIDGGLWYKVMGSTPDSSASGLETSGYSKGYIAFALRGLDVSEIFDSVTPTTANGTSGMPDSPSITPTSDNSSILTVGWLDDDVITATAPTNYTLIASQSVNPGDGSYATLMVAIRNLISSAEDPGVFGGSGTDYWVAYSLVLKRNIVYGNYKNSGVWDLTQVYESKI